MKNRFLNKLYANFFGYYWTDCPLCGEYFGGHEKHGAIWTNGKAVGKSGRAICRKCIEIKEGLLREFEFKSSYSKYF